MCGRHYRADRARIRAAAGCAPQGWKANPLYSIWFERKARGSLCEEWIKGPAIMAAVVGDRPSKTHLLRRLDVTKPYGPDNWVWLDALRREPGETRKAFNARKWASRRAREPEYERRRHLKRKFGITVEDYERMLTEQGGVCAICKGPETTVHAATGMVNSLAVDHCHTTLKVRGLLCWRCNTMIGKVEEDPQILQSMIIYLAEAV